MNFTDLMARPHRWARMLGWATVAGLMCGLVGPYGSYPANGASRILFWVSIFWLGTLLLWPAVAAAMIFGPRRGFPPLFAGAVAALAACVPVAACAAAACSIFWPVHASGIRPQEWYGLTAIIALPAIALATWLEDLSRGKALPSAGATPDAPAEIGGTVVPAGANGRLPERILDLVLCLQMEDHHVRVHTAAGSFLQLAAMGAAVDQLGTDRGLRVHRSWWVARSAVATWSGDARALTLVLGNGLEVPVARNRIAKVRTEGWLDLPDTLRADRARWSAA